jgi:acetyl/propionyl-CoA carboxylase alpha subunit
MMLNNLYQNLQADEALMMLAKLIYAVQNDDNAFRKAHSVISEAQVKGLFNKVKFGHEITSTED